MSNFYFLKSSYSPNTAGTNRMLAYIKELSKLGITTNLVLFLPDEKRSKISDSFPNINVKYYWDSFLYSDIKIIKYLFYFVSIVHFILKVKRNDIVYMYSMADMFHFLLKKRGVRIFVEKTEHPSMYPLGSKVYRLNMKTYLEDCKKADGIITISNGLKDFFIEGGVKENKIQIVNIIVDKQRFENIPCKKYDKPYFAYCGTVSLFKDGVDKLLYAFSDFNKKHKNVELRIAGKFISDKDEKLIKELVEKLHISDSVFFMGQVLANDMPSFLKGAIGVLLSRPDNKQAKYGFPTKLGEYLLSGSPTIVTAVGDIPLFVEDGKNGLLVTPDKPEEFANKMCWVYENPKEAKELGKNGALLAERNFSSKIETKKLCDFLGL